MTSLALTKLDVLSDFEELPVCVRYRLRDGSETEHFPAHQSDFHHAEPVWETLAGWHEPLDNASTLDELPEAAHRVRGVRLASARRPDRARRCRRGARTRPRLTAPPTSLLAYTADAWTQVIVAFSIFVPVVVAVVLTVWVLRGAKNDPDEQRWRRQQQEEREREAD